MSPVYRSLVVLVLAGTSLIAADVACGAEGAPAETINKAGRQRMLVERIVKTYAQIGLDITPDASRRELHDAVRIFEDQLRDARKTAGSKSSSIPGWNDSRSCWTNNKHHSILRGQNAAVHPIQSC